MWYLTLTRYELTDEHIIQPDEHGDAITGAVNVACEDSRQTEAVYIIRRTDTNRPTLVVIDGVAYYPRGCA